MLSKRKTSHGNSTLGNFEIVDYDQTTSELHYRKQQKALVVVGSNTSTSQTLKKPPAISNDLSPKWDGHNIILKKYFNNSKSLKNDTEEIIYENLCLNCGYGVFEAHGKLCDFCQYALRGKFKNSVNRNDSLDKLSNFFEKICERCGVNSASNSALCEICESRKQQKITKSLHNNKKADIKSNRFLSGFLGTSKRAKSSDNSSKIKKLEIVHNVDGYDRVFRTNETFDFAKICELKYAKQKVESLSDNHIYGKLRKTTFDNRLSKNSFSLENVKDRDINLTSSNSDSKLHRISRIVRSNKQGEKFTSNNNFMLRTSEANSSTKVSQQQLKSEAKNFNRDKTLGIAKQQISTTPSTATLRAPDENVIEWMTSLRLQTHDYFNEQSLAGDSICNPKSIPPRNFYTCCGSVCYVDHTLQPHQLHYQRELFLPVNRCSCSIISTCDEDESRNDLGRSLRRSGENENTESSYLQSESVLRMTGNNYACYWWYSSFTDPQQLVNDFKRNLMDRRQRTKRRAIYVKNDEIPSGNLTAAAAATSLPEDFERLTAHCLENYASSRNPAERDNRYVCEEDSSPPSDFVTEVLSAVDSFMKREGDIAANSDSEKTDLLMPQLSSDRIDGFNAAEADMIRNVHTAEYNSTVFVTNPSNFTVKNSSQIVQNNKKNKNSESLIRRGLERWQPGQKSRHYLPQFNNEIIFLELFNARNYREDSKTQRLLSYLINYHKSVLAKSLNRLVLTYDKNVSAFLGATSKFHQTRDLPFSQLYRLYRLFLFGHSSSTRKAIQKRLKNMEQSVIQKNYSRNSNDFENSESSDQTKIHTTNIAFGSSDTSAIIINENIYQPIWKFKTVGNPRESYASSAGENFYELESFAVSMNDDSSLINNMNETTTSNFVLVNTTEQDHGEWETDDEFMFTTTNSNVDRYLHDDEDLLSIRHNSTSTSGQTLTDDGDSLIENVARSNLSLSLNDNNNIKTVNSVTPYQKLAIFYCPKEPKLRAIVYDYDEQKPYFKNTFCGNDSHETIDLINKRDKLVPTNSKKMTKKLFADIVIPQDVQAWKFILLSVDYLDDEEDLYVMENVFMKQPEVTFQRLKSVSTDDLMSDVPQEKQLSIRERFYNKLQMGNLKITSRNQSKDKKRSIFSKRPDSSYEVLNKSNLKSLPIFGVGLQQVEMDILSVPRFVCDCIAIIEHNNNIQTDGIYRASGNKSEIDDIKRKLSENTIYDPKILRNQDVHTVTGLLKLFFRELQTPLVPNTLYQKLPDNLVDKKNSLPVIKRIINEISHPAKDTLKYLLKHLTIVAKYSDENRMPASNLAIVWGPCLFLSSTTGLFDIGRANTLTKVLIENYDNIFDNEDRLV